MLGRYVCVSIPVAGPVLLSGWGKDTPGLSEVATRQGGPAVQCPLRQREAIYDIVRTAAGGEIPAPESRQRTEETGQIWGV